MTQETQSKLSLIRDQRGLTTVEYIILLGLVAVFGITAWTQFGGTLSDEVDAGETRMNQIVPRGE